MRSVETLVETFVIGWNGLDPCVTVYVMLTCASVE